MSDLDVQFSLQTPSGWVDLEDITAGYELHKDAFASRSVGHRKNDIHNEWTHGSYTSRSVKENVIETVDFYVSGATTYQCRTRLETVLEAFDSLSYQAIYRMDDNQETWTCTVADYTLESEQALANARLVIVRAKVPRHPVVTRVQVVAP